MKKILMISTDESIFQEDSSFRKRALEYADLLQHLHVVVFTTSHKDLHEIRKGSLTISSAYGKTKKDAFLHALKLIRAIIKDDRRGWSITTQEEFGGIIGWLFSLRYGLPWHAQLHTDIFSPFFKKHTFKNRARFYIARFTLSRATTLRVVSERVAKGARIIRGPKVFVLPIFTSVEEFQNLREQRVYEHEKTMPFSFLTASRLTSEKNIEGIMLAFERFSKDAPEAILRIVGNGPLKKSLEEKVKLMGFESKIFFEGWAENSELIQYLKYADGYVSNSWYEGYGLSVVEAVAAGVPVIMSDTGVAREIVEDEISGFVFPPGDNDLLTQKLRLLYAASAEKKKRLADAAFARLSHDSWEEYKARFKEILAYE